MQKAFFTNIFQFSIFPRSERYCYYFCIYWHIACCVGCNYFPQLFIGLQLVFVDFPEIESLVTFQKKFLFFWLWHFSYLFLYVILLNEMIYFTVYFCLIIQLNILILIFIVFFWNCSFFWHLLKRIYLCLYYVWLHSIHICFSHIIFITLTKCI